MNVNSDLLNLNSKSPAFSIVIEGKDVTTVLDTRLMSLTLTDNRGFEADQLDLELDDADGLIALPRRGAVIQLALGWKGQPLFPKGAFTVDEIEHSGAPDRLTIRARSADFRETLNTRREKSWHQTTVGEVVKEIAARHNLKMALGKDLTDKALDHLDQTNESDASFLMKLARQYGAIASVKDGNLLFIRQGQGRTASGKPLPVITITRKAAAGYHHHAQSRCRLSPSRAKPVTVIGSPLLIVVPIPVLLPAGCIRVNPGKKRQPVLGVVERKPPHPKSRKQNRAIIWWERMKTCWFLIVPTPTGAMQSAQQKCSGNVCCVGLLHFPCSSLRGGLISIRKCR